MRYNVFFSSGGFHFALTLISSDDLDIILDAYAEGKSEFFLQGRKLDFSKLKMIKIYETDISDDDFERRTAFLKEKKGQRMFGMLGGPIWKPKDFSQIGKEITKDLIGNNDFGWRKGLTLINNSEALTQTFWNLVHDKIKAVAKPRFDSRQYADAVEASFKELNDIIKSEYKSKTGVELDGRSLMQKAFSGTLPAFELVDLSSQSGQNIQEGYRFILAGSMSGIRNPKAHQNLIIDQKDAIEKIILASHLLKVFENRLNP